MVRRSCLVITLLFAGCLSHDPPNELVSPSTFGSAAPVSPERLAGYRTASQVVGGRVDQLGRKIVAANRQFGLEPIFVTIGAPQPEVFHRGVSEIIITDSLANMCKTEGQLAAVLCTELGKMLAEREAAAGPGMRHPDPQPPMDLRIGSSAGGAIGAADQTHLAELAKLEPGRPAPNHSPLPPKLPDPGELARAYMHNAQFSAAELDSAGPILKAASANSAFERQMTQPANGRSWTNP